MKTKIMLICMLTAVSIFIFTGATWADGRKDRSHADPGQKHGNVSKQRQPAYPQNHWNKANPYHGPKLHYRHYASRANHYRHHVRHRPYFNHRLTPRPVKTYRYGSHHRPVYRHTGGSRSIRAAISQQGWSIKIFSKD